MSRNLALTWFGVILTFVGTALAFAYTRGGMPPADRLWFGGACVLVVLVLAASYAGRPRELSRGVSPAVRRLALLVMVLSGGTWLWFLARTVTASDADVWAIRVQRTISLFLFAWAYYLFTQRPRP